MKLADHSGFVVGGYRIKPTTESSIHLGGPTPEDPPRIQPRYLETDDDRRATAAILERIREVIAQPPLARLVEAEDWPGPSVATRDDALQYAQGSGGVVSHAVGAAAMGPDGAAVVDPRLRVRGVEGLRVVDASVFPEQPAGNAGAPTMALAWRAAEMVIDGA
jgi:choline dehydrogenase-like flavoprotein